MAPNVCRKTSEDHFFGNHTKKQYAKVGRKLFGHVWEHLGKNPLHPQKFACSYACDSLYALSSSHRDMAVWVYFSDCQCC